MIAEETAVHSRKLPRELRLFHSLTKKNLTPVLHLIHPSLPSHLHFSICCIIVVSIHSHIVLHSCPIAYCSSPSIPSLHLTSSRSRSKLRQSSKQASKQQAGPLFVHSAFSPTRRLSSEFISSFPVPHPGKSEYQSPASPHLDQPSPSPRSKQRLRDCLCMQPGSGRVKGQFGRSLGEG